MDSTDKGKLDNLPTPSTSWKDGMPDLSKRHERFPAWDRPTLYDVITSMYLECWDDAEVAKSLSLEIGGKITPELVAGIRKEAAMVAESQPLEIRRKWIYRYRNLTVNNIVKEYMFLEGVHNFLKAKRQFAEDLESLVQKTPGDRLWIAVNDAIGRNNIAIEFVHELLAYGKTAKKLEKLAMPYADAKGLAVDEGLKDAALKLKTRYDEQEEKDTAKCIGFMAKLLNQSEKKFLPEDIAFLAEYGRFANDSDTPDASFAMRINRGADIFVKPPSVLEQLLLGDISNHLSSAEIAEILVMLRTKPVMKKEQLEQIGSYARRHITGIQIMKDLGFSDGRPEQLRAMVIKALESLRKVVEDHLCIADFKKFFSNKEMAHAVNAGIKVNDLQTMLQGLNELSSLDQVAARLSELLKTNAEFPAAKYCMKRFGTPGPFKGT